MQSVDGGRHCGHCQKVVVDFTRFTDAQLLDYFRKNEGGCGRFTSEQLNRTIQEVVAPRKALRMRLAAMLLLLFSVSRFTNAQTNSRSSHTRLTQSPTKKRNVHSTLKQVVIRANRIDKVPHRDTMNQFIGLVEACHYSSGGPSLLSIPYTCPSIEPMTLPPVTKYHEEGTLWRRFMFKLRHLFK